MWVRDSVTHSDLSGLNCFLKGIYVISEPCGSSPPADVDFVSVRNIIIPGNVMYEIYRGVQNPLIG